MQITFVGHAGVLFEHNGVGLLCDPWLSGGAFNDSWFAYPAPVLAPEVLERVTHVWVSHEHPDHFSVATLRLLPRTIEVLYQRHWSPLTAEFLTSLGFAKVRLVPHGASLELGSDFAVRLFQVGHEDSALAIRADGETVLNLNDCKPSERTLRGITRRIGAVDLLLDQFSIAGWPGAGGDPLAVFHEHVAAVAPRYVMPFASFVRFGHVENAYMNDYRTPIPSGVVMYPGDSSPLSRVVDISEAARRRYEADERRLADQPLVSHAPVGIDEVREAASQFAAMMRRDYHRSLLRRIRPVAFELTDHSDTVVIDLAETGSDPSATVVLSSQAAHHTFSERWGLPTLLISGRFDLRGDRAAFSRLKQLGALHSNGVSTKGLMRDLASYRSADLLRRGPAAALELAARVR